MSFPTIGEIAGGAAAGLAVDATKKGATAAAETAADRAGSVEHELDVVDGPRPAALWSAVNPHLVELAAIDRRQATIVAALLQARDNELQRLIDAVRASAFETYVQPYWFAAGDGQVGRSFPELPGDAGWTLDAFLAWTDPAAAADAVVHINVDGILAVPMQIVATRDQPANVKIELPVGNSSSLRFYFTPAAGAGGAATDRVAVLAKFRRGG